MAFILTQLDGNDRVTKQRAFLFLFFIIILKIVIFVDQIFIVYLCLTPVNYARIIYSIFHTFEAVTIDLLYVLPVTCSGDVSRQFTLLFANCAVECGDKCSSLNHRLVISQGINAPCVHVLPNNSNTSAIRPLGVLTHSTVGW